MLEWENTKANNSEQFKAIEVVFLGLFSKQVLLWQCFYLWPAGGAWVCEWLLWRKVEMDQAANPDSSSTD